MSISCYDIKETMGDLVLDVLGNSSIQIHAIHPAENAPENTLVFVHQEKYLNHAINSSAAAIAIPPFLLDKVRAQNIQKTIIVSKNVYLLMALVLQKFFPENKIKKPGIHPTAIIDTSSKISPTAYIGPYCVIGKSSVVQDYACLESHITVEDNVQIGANTQVFSNVYIGPRTEIGNNCEIKANSVIGGEGFGFAPDQSGVHHRIPQKGKVVLENSVYIGSLCTIDRATLESGETRIGQGTKIDNHIQIAHNVKIGKNCVFAGGTMIAGSTTIGSHCIVGGHSSIIGHINICDQVHLGGRSGVTGNIEKPGAYAGFPLQPLKEHLKSDAYIKKLPELSKKIKDLYKLIKAKD